MTRRTDNRTTRLPLTDVIAQGGQLPTFEPVPSQTNRRDGWTPERQREFIEALADTGSVEAACRQVNMTTVGAYRIRRLPEGASFAAAWEAALSLGVRRLEDIAMERALNGVEEPFYAYGNLVGTRKRYNDRLLMFMLRNRAPERFGASTNGASLKGLNAIGKMEKRRLKKKWRKQWEAEQAKANVSPAEVRASIDRKVAAIRAQVEAERARAVAAPVGGDPRGMGAVCGTTRRGPHGDAGRREAARRAGEGAAVDCGAGGRCGGLGRYGNAAYSNLNLLRQSRI